MVIFVSEKPHCYLYAEVECICLCFIHTDEISPLKIFIFIKPNELMRDMKLSFFSLFQYERFEMNERSQKSLIKQCKCL
jgi:hypothetical protein